ncbi:MAG: hypothetical protein R3E39_15610 [Anaerolineae bacterium]
MQAERLDHVVFCGENPHIVLYDAAASITAAASFWDCTYSPLGEGRVLLLYLDFANRTALDQPAAVIYTDNAPLARYLTDTFNQHFEDWQDLGFAVAPVQPARFFKEADTRTLYRVACHAQSTHIELLWQDVRPPDLRLMPDLQGGGFGTARDEHYHVANVILLVGRAASVNQRQAAGLTHTPRVPMAASPVPFSLVSPGNMG